MSCPPLSVVIPTYGRDHGLLETIYLVLALPGAAIDLIVVDQTRRHSPEVARAIQDLESGGQLRWIRLSRPSIPAAMNRGLIEARSDVVLFLDDDIVPDERLLAAHVAAHEAGHRIVAGRVLQPWDDPAASDARRDFHFAQQRPADIQEFMGGNFSIRRALALALGGFDENFVRVAYRFEAEFASRALAAGASIRYVPTASIRHLKVEAGGTRSFGDHLRTFMPNHSVGAYYYLMRAPDQKRRPLRIVERMLRSVRTRYHLSRPWRIPATLIAEILGLGLALIFVMRGPRLLRQNV
jgi:GT2 family glycosyltransferase